MTMNSNYGNSYELLKSYELLLTFPLIFLDRT